MLHSSSKLDHLLSLWMLQRKKSVLKPRDALTHRFLTQSLPSACAVSCGAASAVAFALSWVSEVTARRQFDMHTLCAAILMRSCSHLASQWSTVPIPSLTSTLPIASSGLCLPSHSSGVSSRARCSQNKTQAEYLRGQKVCYRLFCGGISAAT